MREVSVEFERDESIDIVDQAHDALKLEHGEGDGDEFQNFEFTNDK